MSFYSNMEEVIKKQGEGGLDHLLKYYGLSLELHRQSTKRDVYSDIHGPDAGGPTNHLKDFVGIVQGDDFLPSDDSFSGGFEVGFLLTKDKDILVGDTVVIVSNDNKSRRFKVTEKQSMGFTTEIFTKWKLSNIGE